ncbi:hypothetical protein AVEN_71303-1 [Araneus ventricosus]|uniref:Uncharacterized protein n=1 Tax=Araneus ventricosus TaxID=182803 RepID=A0A4Y2W697_ARAVE|nr:hypothetical protein AVEN_71303-1 [Araneus ventricosus]
MLVLWTEAAPVQDDGNSSLVMYRSGCGGSCGGFDDDGDEDYDELEESEEVQDRLPPPRRGGGCGCNQRGGCGNQSGRGGGCFLQWEPPGRQSPGRRPPGREPRPPSPHQPPPWRPRQR